MAMVVNQYGITLYLAAALVAYMAILLINWYQCRQRLEMHCLAFMSKLDMLSQHHKAL